MRNNPLRIAAESLSPKIRRDRGPGLYIAYGHLPEHPFFTQELRGEFTALHPSAAGMRAFREWLSADDVPGFANFTDRSLFYDDVVLLSRGIKLLETASSAEELLGFERAVRQRAALLLRNHDLAAGGTLSVCMQIAKELHDRQKGAQT